MTKLVLAVAVAAAGYFVVRILALRLSRLPAVSVQRAALVVAVVSSLFAIMAFRRPPTILSVSLPWVLGAAIVASLAPRRVGRPSRGDQSA